VPWLSRWQAPNPAAPEKHKARILCLTQAQHVAYAHGAPTLGL
jgi:hypothetical protein